MKNLIALGLIALALPAYATPPDSLEVNDTLLGAGPDHVFLLRSSRDNLGQYGADHRDLFLIALSRKDGQERLWPVQRITARDSDDGSGRLVPKVVPLGGSVHPDAVMGHFGAMPLWPRDLAALELAQGEGASVEVLDPAGLVASADKGALVARVNASLTSFLANIESYGRLGPLAPGDLLTTSYGQEHCEASNPQLLQDRLGARVTLLTMTCRLGADEPEISLLQLLPDAAGP